MLVLWNQAPPKKIAVWRPNFGFVVWTDALSILANTVLDCLVRRQTALSASLLIGNKKHTSRYAGFSSFCKSVDWKQKAYLEICWIQLFLPVCWLETKSIPRDVLESIPFASLLTGNKKRTSRYAGFSSFSKSVHWKQKAYLEISWILFFLPVCWLET